jgi:hypothetical protein
VNVILPMRPGYSLPPLDKPGAVFPKGWWWQAKLDDERGILTPDGRLLNRHGAPLAWHKAAAFRQAAMALGAKFPGEILDMALLGFRDASTFQNVRGAIVVLDLPGHARRPWSERREMLALLPELDALSGGGAEIRPCGMYRLREELDPVSAFGRSRMAPGVEGLIGRNPAAWYQPGDSREMVKSRWK